MTTATVLPIVVALLVGLALQPAHDVYKISARHVGIARVEAWLSPRAAVAGAIAASVHWLTRLWRGHSRSLIGAAALLALLAMDQSAAHAGAAGIGLAMIGETAEAPTLADVKKAIEASNKLFEDFKATNDLRIKAIESGRPVDPLITEKLTKLNEAIEKQSKVNEDFMSVQATVNRLEKQGIPVGEDVAKKTAKIAVFNRAAKSLAAANSRPVPTEVDEKAYDEYCAAFDRYLRHGDKAIFDAEKRSLSVGTDPNGGWLVTPDMTGRVVERIFETSPMRQYSGQQTIGTDALEGAADLEEAGFEWIGETGTPSDTATPAVPAPWRIPVHEAAATPKATNKMLEDANIDVQAWLSRKVGDKIGRGFNTAFVSGNGVAKPRGFASYDTEATADASRAWGKFEHILSGANGSFGTDPNGANKLLDLVHAMKDVYAAKGAFYMNRTTLGKARQLTDAAANGHYLFIPSFVAGMPETFLGYPVRKLQDMATYSTTGALAVAFGSMEETYLIVDRLGLTVLVDPYTGKPYVKFYTRARVGGDVVNFESLKFLKFSA